MAKRVVITGLGPVSCIGKDRESFWYSLLRGVSGIKKIERFAASELGYASQIGGEISDFKTTPFLDEKQTRHFSRFTQFAVVSAYLALADAHLDIDDEITRKTGIILGTGIGGLDAVEDQANRLQEKSLKKLNLFTANATQAQAAVAEISTSLRIKGVNYTVTSGCSSSANAIGVAFDNIRQGRSEIILTGGAEAPFTDVVFASFDVTKQLAAKNDEPTKAVIPYSLGRSGFVLAEGASLIVLEELEHAQKRGAFIYGELVGFGSAAEAYHSYKHEMSGEGMASAMKEAAKDAGITPYEIDYICGHGSGSQSADLKETNAVKRFFGARAANVPMSTIKDLMGMPFGASTGFQVIATALMLEHQIMVPTTNYSEPDPECDLDYVPQKPRSSIINYAMINSMGLGGNNAVLIVKKFQK